MDVVVKIQDINHLLKVTRNIYNDNWKELSGKNDKNFLDLCYILSKLKEMEKRMNNGNKI